MAYRSVFVDGKITNPKTGNSVDLKVLSDNEILPYLQDVSIKTEFGVDTNMSITLAPTYEAALSLISKDQEWLRMGNTLALRWGYSDVDGGISDWHMGLMMLPEVSFGEQISITVPAVGYGFNVNRVARVRCWSTPDKMRTFEDVAKEIGRFYGLDVKFELNSAHAKKQLVDTKRIDLQQQGMTDLQFLVRVAGSNGARMVMRNNSIVFVDIGAVLPDSELISATFQMYGKIDVENHVFPMDSFEPESLGTLFLENHQGLAMFTGDPNADPSEDAEPVVANAKDSDDNSFSANQTVDAPTEEGPPAPGMKNSDGSQNRAKSTVKVNTDLMQAGRYVPVAMGADFAEEKAQAVLNSARDSDASDQGIRATITTMAIPWLLPGMIVRVSGVGDFFSASYMIFEKEVTVGDSGANMTLTIGSKGFPGLNTHLDSYAASVKKSNEPAEGNPTENVVSETPNEAE